MSQHNIELKDRWNFYLGIELPEHLQQYAKPIELMVAGVDAGAEDLSLAPGIKLDGMGLPHEVEPGSLHHRTGRLIIWLYDDVKCEMMAAIRALQAAQSEFSIRLSTCGEHGVPEYEAFVYTGCRLEALQHSMYSYEKSVETLKLNIGERNAVKPTHTITGTLSNSSQKPVAMKLLQVAFSNVQHIINTNPEE